MLDLGFVILLTLWSAGIGLRIAKRFGPVPEHPADALALAVPLGLGALALATLGLAECGVLTLRGLCVILALGAWLGGRDALGAMAGLGRLRTGSIPRPLAISPQRLFDLALAITLLGTLLAAMAPVTDGDALCYHLQVPKVFLARGAAFFDPDLHETVYPLATEMLYAVALAVRGPVACRLVQWVLGLAFAANVAALARPVLGPRARWAATIVLLVPAVSNGMGAPLNDVALAAFGNAAIFAWIRWQGRPGPRAAALAGLLAGLALGVKYPALVLAGLLGGAGACGLAIGCWREGRARRDARSMGEGPRATPHPDPPPQGGREAKPKPSFTLRRNPFSRRKRVSNLGESGALTTVLGQAVIFGATAALAGGCWYLRAFVHTGNPVYPFFRQTFGGAGLDEVLDPIKRPMPVTIGNLLTALGPMTLQPDRFDSLSHQLGPAFLLFLPALLWMRPPGRVWGLVALGWAFLTACLCQRQSMRFVLIAVGPMAVGVAWLAAAWSDRRSLPARLLVGAIALMLGFEATLAAARSRHGLAVVFGLEDAGAFLARREPTYLVGRWVAGHLPASARLVGQDHRGFYFPRDYTMELAHRRRTGLASRGESAGAIAARLRADGFTHLLLCPPVPETAVEFDPTLGRRLAPWLATRVPLYRADLADADGVVRRYAVYELADPGRQAAGSESGVRR